MKVPTISCMGFEIVNTNVDALVEEAFHHEKIAVNTINPHSYVEQLADPVFQSALLNSDYLIPDGSGIVLASKVLTNVKMRKIAGFDLFKSTMEYLEQIKGKVFLLGATQEVLDRIVARSSKEYPSVEVNTLSPPFKDKFDTDDLKSFVEEINLIEPDVLFVGLTAPKQEKLIDEIKSDVNVKFSSGIGAVFDFYGETVKRPSLFWIGLHLEWLVRFVGEPKRLWRRNFVSTPIFLIELIFWKLKIKS